jgi:hypothetical protein
LHPVFGIRGASGFLGCSEWPFAAIVIFGILGKATRNFGSPRVDRHVCHDGYHHSVHAERLGSGCWLSGNGRHVPFLMKDIVLLAASIYLLKQDVVRTLEAATCGFEVDARPLATKDKHIQRQLRGDKYMPQSEHFDVLVLGSGTGGKLIAWHMAQSGRRTAVVEKRWVGVSCPNIACMPSKNEIASAKIAHLARDGENYGAVTGSVTVDMATVRRRKREMVERQISICSFTGQAAPS